MEVTFGGVIFKGEFERFRIPGGKGGKGGKGGDGEGCSCELPLEATNEGVEVEGLGVLTVRPPPPFGA